MVIDEKVIDPCEKIRLRGIQEGKLFDCYIKCYAERIDVDNRTLCKGHQIGVGGHHVSMNCETCTCYYVKYNSKK